MTAPASEAVVLASYGVNVIEIWHRVATYVDKILRGASPAELAIEQTTAFELVVNVGTAKTLGLTIPPWVASRVAAWVQ